MLNKKAQGLPIQFIVLIALAMLVLFLVATFVLSSFRTEAVNSQTAINNCNSRCTTEMQYARNHDSPYNNDRSPFCAISQDIRDYGESIKCDEIVSCTVTTRDGASCVISCAETSSSCEV